MGLLILMVCNDFVSSSNASGRCSRMVGEKKFGEGECVGFDGTIHTKSVSQISRYSDRARTGNHDVKHCNAGTP